MSGRGEYVYVADSEDEVYQYEGLYVLPYAGNGGPIETWLLPSTKFYGTRRLADGSVTGLYEYREISLGTNVQSRWTLKPAIRLVRAPVAKPKTSSIKSEYPDPDGAALLSIRSFLGSTLSTPLDASDTVLEMIYIANRYASWDSVKTKREKSPSKFPMAHKLYKWLEREADRLDLAEQGTIYTISTDLLGHVLCNSFSRLQDVAEMAIKADNRDTGYKLQMQAAATLTKLYQALIPDSFLDGFSTDLEYRLKDMLGNVSYGLESETIEFVNKLFSQDCNDLRRALAERLDLPVNERTDRFTWTAGSDRAKAWTKHGLDRKQANETIDRFKEEQDRRLSEIRKINDRRFQLLEAKLGNRNQRPRPGAGDDDVANKRRKVITYEEKVKLYLSQCPAPSERPPEPTFPPGTFIIDETSRADHGDKIDMKFLATGKPGPGGARVWLTNTGIYKMFGGTTGQKAMSYRLMRSYLLKHTKVLKNDAAISHLKKGSASK